MTRITDLGICRYVDSDVKKFTQDDGQGHHGAAFKHARQRQGSDATEIDQALRKRLDQLRDSMGEQATTGGTEPNPLPQETPIGPVPHGRFRGRTVLASSLVSACIGAAVAWNAAIASGGQTNNAPVAGHASASVSVPEAPMATAPNRAALEAAPTASPQSEKVQLNEVLESWRRAWSSRDVEAYLGHYSDNFVPQGGQTRPAWAEARRKHIAARNSISIEVRGLQIERMNDQRVRLAFLQDYAAGSYREVARPKVLELVREGPIWRIVSERQNAG